MPLHTSMPLAAIDPTLVIWFIVGIVYFIAQIFEKIRSDAEDSGAPEQRRPNRPQSNTEQDLREFLEQLTGHDHHDDEEEEEDEINFQQPVITFDTPPSPPSMAVMALDEEPTPDLLTQEQQKLNDVYKVAAEIKAIKDIKSLEESMAEGMSRGGSTASMLVKLFNVRMPHMKYAYTPSNAIRKPTKAPSLKGKHALAQAQLARIILESPKALEEKPFEL